MKSKNLPKLPDTYGSPTYFFDATNDCASIAAALREQGRKVVQFHELFKDSETKDPIWMREVCRRGYIVVTKDKNLLNRTNCLMIWYRAKGRIFQLASGVSDRHQITKALLAALRKMEKIIETVPPPFVVRILVGGEVEMVRPDDLDLPFLSDTT